MTAAPLDEYLVLNEHTTRKLAVAVSAAGQLCGLPQHHVTLAINAGALVPHAVGRRSILLVADLDAWLRGKPRTKSRAPGKEKSSSPKNPQHWE